jgi:hypothetical protein
MVRFHNENGSHPHVIYTYDPVHLEEAHVSCQNCGKTLSFQAIEIVLKSAEMMNMSQILDEHHSSNVRSL